MDCKNIQVVDQLGCEDDHVPLSIDEMLFPAKQLVALEQFYYLRFGRAELDHQDLDWENIPVVHLGHLPNQFVLPEHSSYFRYGRVESAHHVLDCENTRVRATDYRLAATTTEMLDNGFIKSYEDLYKILFDNRRPSANAILQGYNNHLNTTNYGIQGSSSISEVDSNGPSQKTRELNRKQLAGSNGENSPLGLYVSIDIPSAVDQQWKEYIADRKKGHNSIMISESTLAITGQAVGSLLSSVLSGSSEPSWTRNFVAVATVFGIAFTLAGFGLRRGNNPRLSGITMKLGAVSTASAIILALGLTVVPAVAWTTGAVACLLIAIGVAMA